MITIKIKIAAAAAAFAVSACMQCASAEAAENITVLGDSISTGYGLDDGELSYCGYLQEYFDAELDNFAKDGRQTAELIQQLENDEDVISSIQEADLICVSIGGNDVLQIFLDSFSELKNIGGNNSNEQFALSGESVQGFIMKYSSAFGPAAAQASENIAEIREKISELNPEAPVIIQTVYNPFETDDEKLNSIMKPLKTFAAMYLGVINNAVRQQPAVIADIHKKFDNNSWLYTNIKEFDIHPNYIGHMLIAEEIVQSLEQPGNGEIFKAQLEKLPKDYLNSIPGDITDEIIRLANGQFRGENNAESTDSLTAENEIKPSEEASKASQEQSSETQNINKTEQKKKSKLSSLLFYTGIILISASVLLKVYSKLRKRMTKK